MRTLVLGGARSGKSAFAEQLVITTDCLYVATARPWSNDADFAERIHQHQNRRPPAWRTEDQKDVIEVLHATTPEATILVDDLGTWVTHTIDAHDAWDCPRGTMAAHYADLVKGIAAFPPHRDLIIVSPEVGMGIIPEHRAGRLFRDELGFLNAQVAQACDQVFFVVAGLPLQLKPGR